MDRHKYKINSITRQIEILSKKELKDYDKLELIMLDIEPYSFNWRIGVKRALKKAIKLLKEEEK